MRSKIVTADQLVEIVKRAKDEGKNVVHCHGVFDLVHPGHINYFEQAKKIGDIVYVGIVADRFVKKGPGRPRFSEDVRLAWVAALECVDYVVLNEEEGPWSLIRTVRPNFYTKGESDRPKLDDPNSGLSQDKRVLEEVGAKLRFTPEVEIHSTDLFQAMGVEEARVKKD
ncbi:MAG: adenylyltransferase/cytidyltransferase family protein [Patescibacteria group bacterium]